MPCTFSSTFVYFIGLLSLGALIILPTIHTQEDAPQYYLDAHNSARLKVGVGPMTWNETLATYAEKYASTRVADCTREYSGGPYGENLIANSRNRSSSISGTDIMNIWVAEKANYDSRSNACVAGRSCRNYTQVVWQNSRSLGCAKVRCSDGGYFFSCNYDPPGNLIGQRPFEINESAPSPEPVLAPSPAQPPNFDFVPPSPEPVLAPSPAQPPNFDFVPPSNYTEEDRRNAIGLVAGLIAGASALILLGLVFVWFFLRWKRKQKESTYPVFDVSFGNEFENGTGPRKFSYRELASATNNFCEETKLGEGGFGGVYKGFLKDLNTFVAVKKVSKRSKQGSKEYTAEVKIISQLRHRNTVKLIGWCHEKDLILVYEFMPNGSLDSHLFKGKSLLTWDVRNKIVQGLASALLYLHEEGDDCVLHRDIKSSNIMLDSEFNAKLGDFGLARFVDHAKGSQTTALAGTIGYMAPECLTARKASKESDVFSFGIVVLEIVCGRRSIEHRCDESQVSLVPWVWESYGNKRLVDVVDKKLGTNFDIKKMECLMIVGLWCAHPARNLRPSISQAIQGLNFELPLPNLPSKMPVPNYDVPSSSTPAPASTAMSSDSLLSLTVPR